VGGGGGVRRKNFCDSPPELDLARKERPKPKTRIKAPRQSPGEGQSPQVPSKGRHNGIWKYGPGEVPTDYVGRPARKRGMGEKPERLKKTLRGQKKTSAEERRVISPRQ